MLLREESQRHQVKYELVVKRRHGVSPCESSLSEYPASYRLVRALRVIACLCLEMLYLGFPGVSWFFPGFPGVSWGFLVFPGSSWGFLGFSGVCWGHVAIMLLIATSDWRLAWRFVTGFRVVGTSEFTGLGIPLPFPTKYNKETLFQRNQEVISELPTTIIDWAADIRKDYKKEYSKGRVSELLTREDLDGIFGEGRWAACPTFAISQYDKTKKISDARRGFQNSASNFSEKLTLCNALQPARVFRVMSSFADSAGIDMSSFNGVSGGGDVPDAYKTCPVDEGDLDVTSKPYNKKTAHGYFAYHTRFFSASLWLYGISIVSANSWKFSCEEV